MSEDNAESAKDLFSEVKDEELRCLVSTQDSKGFLTWDVVKEEYEDFTIETWGRAIENGLVERESGDTFKLTRRSEISKYLSGQQEQNDTEDSEDVSKEDLPEVDYSLSKWRRKDFVITGVGLILMLGFQVSQIRNVVYAIMDIPLGLLNQFMPLFSVVFVAAIFTSAWSHYVREGLHDVNVDKFRERLSALQGNDEGGMLSSPDDVDSDKQDEIMKLQAAMMKSQMKPFGWILILTIPTILWFQATATGLTAGVESGSIIFPVIGEKVWASNLIGPFRVWIFWYIVCTVTLTQLVKKYFPLD
jgi:uncharacterized membrane protein (DUF106 family)